MSKKVYITQVLMCVLLLALVVCMESYSGMDVALQNLWFEQSSGEWFIPQATHQEYRGIFYGGAKRGISIIAGICALLLVIGLVRKAQRHVIFPCLLLLLSLAAVPASVGVGKKITNVRCPEELAVYGGTFPYERVLECKRTNAAPGKPGRCFPAGHASGGFALMALYFCLRRRWLGLGIGLSAGWIMGIYQMLRGEHFLSHTLATMVLAWLLILLLLPVARKLATLYINARHWSLPEPASSRALSSL
ncbi:phosphatase PAP2 family protein [Desulfovibrio sp. OttesenSCG-928-G15]|nr:phosphatase PAP2 family protein [Desulfovibrio sp. OttesenSCG-928-G15]